MELACYYDFTCGYSFRAWSWFERQRAAGADLEIDWRPFVLKEVNRPDIDPSLLSGPVIGSVAVLALAIAEAVGGGSTAEAFRSTMFHAMHTGDERPDRDEVSRIAEGVGVDLETFAQDEGKWLAAVRASHEGAVSGLGVFGTPTLVFEGQAMYLKLAALPADGDETLWDALTTVTTRFPEVLELKRPRVEESS